MSEDVALTLPAIKGAIARLEVRPGDVVVITVPDSFTESDISNTQRIMTYLRNNYGISAPALILKRGMSIQSVSRSVLEELLTAPADSPDVAG